MWAVRMCQRQSMALRPTQIDQQSRWREGYTSSVRPIPLFQDKKIFQVELTNPIFLSHRFIVLRMCVCVCVILLVVICIF